MNMLYVTCYIISYHIISYHITLCHIIMSYHIMPAKQGRRVNLLFQLHLRDRHLAARFVVLYHGIHGMDCYFMLCYVMCHIL